MIKSLTKIILTAFIAFAVVFVGFNVYKNKNLNFDLKPLEILKNKIITLVNPETKSPCEQPILYSIGDIDKNFGLSRDDFLLAVKEAESMWEKQSGKELFNYSNAGALKINLVYDKRQANTNRLNDILSKITGDQGKLNALKTEYNNLATSVKNAEDLYKVNGDNYKVAQEAYSSAVASYNSQLADYSSQVEQWNFAGGASAEEYKKLTAEKSVLDNTLATIKTQQDSLKQKFDELDQLRIKVNDLISQLNTAAGIFNSMAQVFNSKVNSYNAIGGTGEEFVSGLYTSDQNGNKIDIFQFYNHKDLVATIAHELGHALGLGHASSSNSIMYPKAEGQRVKLSSEDLKMLNTVCK